MRFSLHYLFLWFLSLGICFSPVWQSILDDMKNGIFFRTGSLRESISVFFVAALFAGAGLFTGECFPKKSVRMSVSIVMVLLLSYGLVNPFYFDCWSFF